MDNIYFSTYSAAVEYAIGNIPASLTYQDEEYFTEITCGRGKPGEGKTTEHRLPLYKENVHVKYLVISVYNRGGNIPYELNSYVS